MSDATRDALVTLEFDGPVAILSNNRPEKHNAANDAMDTQTDTSHRLQDEAAKSNPQAPANMRVTVVGR